MRSLGIFPESNCRLGGHSGDSAEAAFAVAEVAECGGEIGLIEVWPHAVGEDQFSIRRFPEKEIGEALLAAGADEQVDITAVRDQACVMTECMWSGESGCSRGDWAAAMAVAKAMDICPE